MGKIFQELGGELAQIGERTEALETKFEDLVQYAHVLEEENVALKHTVSQLQLQQEDLKIGKDAKICAYEGYWNLSAIITFILTFWACLTPLLQI